MAMSNSFIDRMITDFRKFSDEPAIAAKYTDADVIRLVEYAYAAIINEINRNKTEPIVARFDVTYSASTATSSHILPYYIGSIHAIYRESTLNNDVKIFYDSRSRLNRSGRRIWVEGYTLHIQPNVLSDGDIITIEYVPTGTARLHDGTCTVDSTGLLVTFGATPTDGTLDTHVNAYAGCIFRIVSDDDASYNYMQERTIVSYVNSTRVATLDVALSPNAGDGVQSGTTYYEIAPAIHYGLDHIVALFLSWWIVSIEGSMNRARLLQRMYAGAIRNLRLTAYYSNLPASRKAREDNYDRIRRYRR
jgi:hypothetical protein